MGKVVDILDSTVLSEAWIAFLEFAVIVMGRVASFIAGQKGSHGG